MEQPTMCRTSPVYHFNRSLPLGSSARAAGELQFREVLEIIAPGDPPYASTQLTEVPAFRPHEYLTLRSQNIMLPYVNDKGENLKLSLGPTRLDGRIIRNAYAALDTTKKGGYKISFRLTEDAIPEFAQLTTELEGKQLAIVLGYKLESFPTINAPITNGEGEITGTFTQQEVRDLASVLNSGALELGFEENPTIEEF